MLSSRTGARRSDEGIVVANVRTGARLLLPPAAAKLVERLLEPTTLAEAVLHAGGGEPARMVAAVGYLRDLFDLGLLVPAAQEIGPGCPPPGLPAGWDAAAAFIAHTRTSAEVAYFSTEELSALLWAQLDEGRQPSCFCDRPDAAFLPLPAVDPAHIGLPGPNRSLAELLFSRRTARRFSDKALSAATLSQLLYLVWGALGRIDNPLGDFFLRKTSPSGGSLHPVEVYAVIRNVEDIPPGVYHYSVRRHGLELISDESPDGWIVDAGGGQYWLNECPALFVSTGFLPRMAWKYRFSRALRVVMFDAGHLSQTLNLVATWLGLGIFTTAALRDGILEEKLRLDPLLEPPLLLNGVGYLEGNGVDPARPRHEEPSAANPAA